jgi:hypothetical protein
MLGSSRDVCALRGTHASHHRRTRSKQIISEAWRHNELAAVSRLTKQPSAGGRRRCERTRTPDGEDARFRRERRQFRLLVAGEDKHAVCQREGSFRHRPEKD